MSAYIFTNTNDAISFCEVANFICELHNFIITKNINNGQQVCSLHRQKHQKCDCLNKTTEYLKINQNSSFGKKEPQTIIRRGRKYYSYIKACTFERNLGACKEHKKKHQRCPINCPERIVLEKNSISQE